VLFYRPHFGAMLQRRKAGLDDTTPGPDVISGHNSGKGQVKTKKAKTEK